MHELTAAELIAALSAANKPLRAQASQDEIRDLIIVGLMRLGLGRVQDLNDEHGNTWSLLQIKAADKTTPQSDAPRSAIC